MKLLVGVVQRAERKESCLLKGVKSVSIHADIVMLYLPCCLYEPIVSRLHLIDYYGGLWARGNAIKD